MMPPDIRNSILYREAEALCETLRRPGAACISDAAEIHASPDGHHAVFTGTIVELLEGAPPTRICEVDLQSGATRILTAGPRVDRFARYSPRGDCIAFLSDRHRAGDFQLHRLDRATGSVRADPHVQGWIEYLQWSADGRLILLGVAGHGADVAGGQGAVTSKRTEGARPSWLPAVETGNESYRRRHLAILDCASGAIRQVAESELNCWEGAWCGDRNVVSVVSSGAGEGEWYTARLAVFDLSTGESRGIYSPKDQIGCVSASPSGAHVAVVEGVCSDRWIVSGDLMLIDMNSGEIASVDTAGVDITYTEWRSDRSLLVAGHRGFETVVGVYSLDTRRFAETWASAEISTGGFYIAVSGTGERGDCVLVGESFTRAPEVAAILRGEYRAIASFDHGYGELAQTIERVERVSWNAPDGLEIQGWLLLPRGLGPFPLVLNVHGGPVGHWRPTWLGRRHLSMLMLLRHGYTVFLPNPRGSSGRGTSFARRVIGDLGGADTRDHLSGLDSLVAQGFADSARLGVTGVSYGGYMSSWLITQDDRFAAAVPVAPATNHVTAHLLSNIPDFVAIFLNDSYSRPGSRYFDRSPVMHAHKAKTPTLNVCGALDRCTPAVEAMQFHNALLDAGTKSVLVTYPEEGHGIRRFPAVIDFAARTVMWFEQHMGAGIKPADDKGCESPTAKQ